MNSIEVKENPSVSNSSGSIGVGADLRPSKSKNEPSFSDELTSGRGIVSSGDKGLSGRGDWRIILSISLLGTLFYWLSLPPLKFPWASFVACGFWSGLVLYPVPIGRRGYFLIYLAGCLLWLALLQGIRLAYWPLYGGWIALSLYVAVYLPLFVGTARLLRERYKVSLPLACSISWVGWELVRSYFATGFSACMLGHAMTPWPMMLDVAAHFGMFGVSFFVMLAGSAMGYFLWGSYWSRRVFGLRLTSIEAFGSLMALATSLLWIVYSSFSFMSYQKHLDSMKPIKPLGRFLIVQGNMPTMFESNIDSLNASWSEYARSTRSAVNEVEFQDIDAVLWPESTFDSGRPLPWSHFDWDGKSKLDPQWGIESMELKMLADESLARKWERLTPDTKLPIAYLVGGGVLTLKDGAMSRFNTALWLTPNPERPSLPNVDYYAKTHLVMFGEYIPFADWFPGLLDYIGLGTMNSGDRFVGWRPRSGCTIAPSVCFENVVPQLIHRQVKELTEQGNAPDLLVNVTNDAWFRGSSLLDHHLNNAIGCSVENRTPMLVAANNGVSAWIDSTGTIVQSLDRFVEGTLLAEPIPDGRWGLWQSVGDLPAKFLAVMTLGPWIHVLGLLIYRRFENR